MDCNDGNSNKSDLLRQVKDTINQIIEMRVGFEIDKMVLVLSEEYNLDKKDIYQKMTKFNLGLEQKRQMQQVMPVKVNDDKCLGKTKYNMQCSRSKQKLGLFCGSHLHKLPYGRVDDPSPEKNFGKKRGRPRKENPASLNDNCPNMLYDQEQSADIPGRVQ